MVHLMVGAANDDPADHIDPASRRPPPGHPSELQRRIDDCLGAALARLEATTLLTGVLRRSPPCGSAVRPPGCCGGLPAANAARGGTPRAVR